MIGYIGGRILDLELQWNCKTGQIVQSGASVSVIANQFKIRENQVEKFNLYFEGTIFSATDLFNRIDILEIDSNGIVYVNQGRRC
jgi:aspartate 1-decarboxylase